MPASADNPDNRTLKRPLILPIEKRGALARLEILAMALIAGLNAGLAGFQGALADLDRTARRVASGGAELDVAAAMVELHVEEATAKLNLAVIRTGDEMLGTLLDVVR